jgi:CRISPR-associated protein Cmr3
VYHSEKPPKEGAPNYWYYDQFLKWLKSSDEKDLWTGPIVSGQLGHNGPVYEERVHVAIKAESHTGKDGLLFATSGLEFTAAIPPATSEQSDNPSDDREKKHSLTTTRQLALAIIIDDVPDPDDTVSQQVQQLKLPLQPGPNTLGGEQRLVHWNKHQQAETILECPKEIEQTIKDKGACRLILLTPAYFSHGNIPTWLQKERDGVTPRLQAIVNQRPQVVSGWDIANKKPKASSRLLPAGSVLFLTLDGDEVARAAWIKSIWLHCISDDIPKDESVSPKQGQQANLAEHPDQYRRDGFGLAVLGIWSGKPCSLDLTSLEKKGTAQ